MSELRTYLLESKDCDVFCDGTMTRAAIYPSGELKAWSIRNFRDRRLWDCGWSTMPGRTAGCVAVMDDFGDLRAVS